MHRALTLMREALHRMHAHEAEIALLGQIVQAWPDDTTARTALRDAVALHGFTVRKVEAEPNAFPARACIAFTLPLPRRDTLHPGDYVTTAPRLPGLAVSAEQGRLCLTGLPPGATTTVTVHPGLPAIAGTKLDHALTVKVTLANRKPSLLADPTHYIIPASNPPAIGFSSVNISRLKVRIARVGERSLRGFLADHPLLNQGNNTALNGQNARDHLHRHRRDTALPAQRG